MDITAWIAPIVSGLITATFSGVSVFFTMNRKIAIIETKLDSLEKKQDKHNDIIERTYKCEARLDVLENLEHSK